MYLDEYRLKPIDIGLDLVDPIYQQALVNRRRATKLYIAWFLLTVAYICLTVSVGGDTLKPMKWLFMAVMVSMPVPGFLGTRKVLERIVRRSVTTRLLRLVVTYTVSGYLHVELDYPFWKMRRIDVGLKGITVRYKGIGRLELPVEMFASEKDMRGYAKALSVAARCELVEGGEHAV